MKSCKTALIAFVLIFSFFITSVHAETVFEIDDEIDDVFDATSELKTSSPNVDVKKVKIDRDGKTIDAILELNEKGTVLSSGVFSYAIILKTTKYEYGVIWGIVENETKTEVYAVRDEDEIILKDFDIEDNILSFSFSLEDENEKCIGLEFSTLYIDVSNLLYDYLNIDLFGLNDYEIPLIDAGVDNTTEVGEELTLTGTVLEGDISGYEWIWVFDNIATPQEGKTIKYTFISPGYYNGTVYAFNENTGLYTEDYFTLQVLKKGSTSADSRNEPGFEIIVFIAALAIALIILSKKRKK